MELPPLIIPGFLKKKFGAPGRRRKKTRCIGTCFFYLCCRSSGMSSPPVCSIIDILHRWTQDGCCYVVQKIGDGAYHIFLGFANRFRYHGCCENLPDETPSGKEWPLTSEWCGMKQKHQEAILCLLWKSMLQDGKSQAAYKGINPKQREIRLENRLRETLPEAPSEQHIEFLQRVLYHYPEIRNFADRANVWGCCVVGYFRWILNDRPNRTSNYSYQHLDNIPGEDCSGLTFIDCTIDGTTEKTILQGATFRQCRFTENCKFKDVDMRGAQILQCTFSKKCTFEDVDMRGALFGGCELIDTLFVQKTVPRDRHTGHAVVFEDCCFDDVSKMMLSKLVFRRCIFRGRCIKECDFRDASFFDVSFQGTSHVPLCIEKCNFRKSFMNETRMKYVDAKTLDWREARIDSSRFSQSSFREQSDCSGCKVWNTRLDCVALNEVVMVEVEFLACCLQAVNMRCCDLSNTTFINTKWTGVQFMETILKGSGLPDAPTG